MASAKIGTIRRTSSVTTGPRYCGSERLTSSHGRKTDPDRRLRLDTAEGIGEARLYDVGARRCDAAPHLPSASIS
jgi:hypothetical protein